MRKEKIPLSLNIVYWVTNFLIGLLILASIGFVMFNIVLYVTPSNNDISFSMPLPIEINLFEGGNLKLNNQSIDVELAEMSGDIKLINPPRSLVKLVFGLMIIPLSFVSMLILIFRKIILNVRMGKVFTINNIILIKFLSYGFFGIYFITTIGGIILSSYFMKILEFDQFEKGSFKLDFFNNIQLLFFAILLWVLAHIFMTGMKLEEEKNLTI